MASPSDIAGQLAWGNAGDRSELADGGQVGTLTDRITGITYVNSTTSQRPLYRPIGLKGKPAFQFAGLNSQRLVSSSNFTIPSSWTFWAVTQRISTDGGGAAAAVSADITGARIAQCGWTGGNTTRAVGFVGSSAVIDSGSNLSFGVPAVMTSLGSSSNGLGQVHHIVNGVEGTPTNASSGALTGGTAPIAIARSGAGSPNYLDGYVAEFGVYDHALDAAERSILHTYVQDFYGIQVADYDPGYTSSGVAVFDLGARATQHVERPTAGTARLSMGGSSVTSQASGPSNPAVVVMAKPISLTASMRKPSVVRRPDFVTPTLAMQIKMYAPRVYSAQVVYAPTMYLDLQIPPPQFAFVNAASQRPLLTRLQIQPRYFDAVTKVIARVAIFNNDASVIWEDESLSSQRLIEGSVSVDYSRDERRNFDLTLSNFDKGLRHQPDGFWYNKVLKLYRGIEVTDRYGKYRDEYQLGEFLIDKLDTQSFPSHVQASGRDYTKRLLLSKFPQALTFSAANNVIQVIKNIATNAGITKFNLPVDNRTLGMDYTYERGDERWKPVKAMANDFGYEVFFDAQGVFTLRPFRDPSTSPTTHTFATGPEVGNLYSYKSSSNDTSLCNHVVVSGEGPNKELYFAEAVNTNPASPTSVSKIGDRVYEYKGQYLASQQQADDLAKSLLRINALEEYAINFSGIIAPWLEAGDIVRFDDPDPLTGAEVDRYLLTSFSVPLGLGSMEAAGRRVTIVS